MTDIKKRPRCLVIQLARLGDTIQSLMALRAAKQLYPNVDFHLITREKFAAAAQAVPWLSGVTVLPTEDLVGPVITGERSEGEALRDLARWVQPLVQEPWDYLFNWSFSDASSYLTAILPAHVKLGYTRHNDLTIHCPDGWSQYMQAIVQGGVEQNIHLTDILTTQLLTAFQIHIGEPADPGNAAVTSKGFFELAGGYMPAHADWRDPSKKWIGIQLGAGHPSKIWPAESWAQVATYLLHRHPDARIILLGGQEDQARAKEFFAHVRRNGGDLDRVVSEVGKTKFDVWAAVVQRCQWIMAGDTAVIHLASVLGTRVLNVSIGPVKLQQTGPYGNGHYVIAPREGEELLPQAVYGTWAYASSEWSHRRQVPIEKHFARLGWTTELSKAQLFRSRIRSTSEGGGVVYELMLDRPLPLELWSSQVIGHIARAWYCGWVPEVGNELVRAQVHPELVQKLRSLQESAQVLQKLCDEACKAATTLWQKSAQLKSDKVMALGDRDVLRDLGKRLMDIDLLIDRTTRTQPVPLEALSKVSKVLMHNLKGEQLAELGRESAECYRQLSQGAVILRDWIGHTLKLARPVAIAGTNVVPLKPEQSL